MVRKKFSKKEILAGSGGILIVLAVLTFIIWHQTETINLGFKARDLEERILRLNGEIQKMKVRRDSLRSLDRVERIAREKLSLESAKPEQVIFDDQFKRP